MAAAFIRGQQSTGIFNGLLSSVGYVAPEIVDGVTVAIPGNTTAEIVLPDGSRRRVQSGTHVFSW